VNDEQRAEFRDLLRLARGILLDVPYSNDAVFEIDRALKYATQARTMILRFGISGERVR
jgi:hypothetical protein